MRKNKEFILFGTNLNENPRTKSIPANFTPNNHIENSISLSEKMHIREIIIKTLKNIGARDIIDKVISLNDSLKMNEVTKGLVDYLDSNDMIQKPKEKVLNKKLKNN